MSFFQRQKILKRLWSRTFELQNCGHTEKSNYGLNLTIILMFLTIYGVGKLQCDRSIGVVFKSVILKISDQETERIDDNKITGLAGKTPRYGKTKTYFDTPSKWLERMILREQENVFLSEFVLILAAVLKCLF